MPTRRKMKDSIKTLKMHLKDSRIMNYMIIYLDWTKQKIGLLLIFLPLTYLYSALHEFVHYWIMQLLGYSGKITWGFAYHVVFNESQMLYKHFFLIAIAPYILDMAILAAMFLLVLKMPERRNLFAKIAIFPFLDFVGNIFLALPSYFGHWADDFSNIVINAAASAKGTLGSVILFIALLSLIYLYLFKPFASSIWNLLKYDRNSSTF